MLLHGCQRKRVYFWQPPGPCSRDSRGAAIDISMYGSVRGGEILVYGS